MDWLCNIARIVLSLTPVLMNVVSVLFAFTPVLM